MSRLFFLCLMCCLTPNLARTQVPEVEGAEPGEETRSVRIWVANDLFYLPLRTDQYYTNGIGLDYQRSTAAGKQFGWRIRQDVFTPRDISATTLLTDDRPYASYLTVSRYWQAATAENWKIRHEVTAGVLGKYSGGGKLQNLIHGMVDFADELEGWRYEVKSDVIVNYGTQVARDWVAGEAILVETHGGARVGTLYTDLTAGATLAYATGRGKHRYRATFRVSNNVSLIGYNATLTGGLVNEDDRYRGVIDPNRLVNRLGYGVTFNLGRVKLGADVMHWSPEFKGGEHHVFAWLEATYLW